MPVSKYEEESRNACPYGAIHYEDREVLKNETLTTMKVAVVRRILCQGCGCCPPGVRVFE